MPVTNVSSSTASKAYSSSYRKRLRQMLTDWRLWGDKLAERRLFLQRRFWSPLRSTMQIFHVLPLTAVVILFVLVATDGQFQEIYISYLEGPSNGVGAWIATIAAALATMTLISAVLLHAHNALSTMHVNLSFSRRADPRAELSLSRLQRAAGFVLAFLPWLGLTAGLFGARNFVAARYSLLDAVAQVDGAAPPQQSLPQPNAIECVAALVVLGAATAFFAAVDDRNRSRQWAVAWLSPTFAVLLFLLLTDGLSAAAPMSEPLWLYAVVAVATGIYVGFYYRLYNRRSGSWPMRLLVRTGVSFRKRRRRRIVLWALLPWLALVAYFVMLTLAMLPSGWLALAPALGRWSIFPVAMCCTLALGLLVGHFLLRLGSSKRGQLALVGAVGGLAAIACLLSWHDDPDLFVTVYRFIGPLATASLQLLFLIAIFAGLALLSRQSGFPALTLVALTVVVCVIFPTYAWLTLIALAIAYIAFAFVALLSGRYWAALLLFLLVVVGWINFHEINLGSLAQNATSGQTKTAASAAPGDRDLKTDYLCWLANRGVNVGLNPQPSGSCTLGAGHTVAAKGKYPVFIVATEGGGIYATIAAATFLADMETLAPGFADHIFAISGVSGGAIGAAVFQALDDARHPVQTAATSKAGTDGTKQDKETCTRQTAAPVPGGLTASIARIMEDDHLSPILGAIFPEIFDAPLKRPNALTASFEYSTATQDQAAAKDLCAPFLDHWSPAGEAPALILNSTWVEEGFRVAFAPFHLHNDLVDASLYSFPELMPNEQCPRTDGQQRCPSLMTAAGVSARFPAIMPPFSVGSWNFVDGGYADNSGATTALDVYLWLKDAVPTDAVDLHLVLIASPPPNLRQPIAGTDFRDTVAPIDAILKVREDLGNDAVARACSEIYRAQMLARPPSGASANGSCTDQATSSSGGPLEIVQIDNQTYGLSLGWKISKTSFAVIEWILGNPTICPEQSSQLGASRQSSGAVSTRPVAQGESTAANDYEEKMLRDNSCVLKYLVSLINGSPAGGAN